MRYVETPKDLYEFIEDAESNIRLEDVDVTKVLEYGHIVLFHKIAAMIGLSDDIEKRCIKGTVEFSSLLTRSCIADCLCGYPLHSG